MSKVLRDQDPFNAGKTAFRLEIPLSSNPYRGVAAVSFANGYAAARAAYVPGKPAFSLDRPERARR